MRKLRLFAVVLVPVVAACGASASPPKSTARSTTASAPTTASVPGSAPPAAVACQDFRAATSAESKADPSGTNLKAIKTFGTALIEATKPLNAKPGSDPALASALGLAGAANLAIAVGYEPHGVVAAYKAATKYVNAVGVDCTALGY